MAMVAIPNFLLTSRPSLNSVGGYVSDENFSNMLNRNPIASQDATQIANALIESLKKIKPVIESNPKKIVSDYAFENKNIIELNKTGPFKNKYYVTSPLFVHGVKLNSQPITMIEYIKEKLAINIGLIDEIAKRLNKNVDDPNNANLYEFNKQAIGLAQLISPTKLNTIKNKQTYLYNISQAADYLFGILKAMLPDVTIVSPSEINVPPEAATVPPPLPPIDYPGAEILTTQSDNPQIDPNTEQITAQSPDIPITDAPVVQTMQLVEVPVPESVQTEPSNPIPQQPLESVLTNVSEQVPDEPPTQIESTIQPLPFVQPTEPLIQISEILPSVIQPPLEEGKAEVFEPYAIEKVKHPPPKELLSFLEEIPYTAKITKAVDPFDDPDIIELESEFAQRQTDQELMDFIAKYREEIFNAPTYEEKTKILDKLYLLTENIKLTEDERNEINKIEDIVAEAKKLKFLKPVELETVAEAYSNVYGAEYGKGIKEAFAKYKEKLKEQEAAKQQEVVPTDIAPSVSTFESQPQTQTLSSESISTQEEQPSEYISPSTQITSAIQMGQQSNVHQFAEDPLASIEQLIQNPIVNPEEQQLEIAKNLPVREIYPSTGLPQIAPQEQTLEELEQRLANLQRFKQRLEEYERTKQKKVRFEEDLPPPYTPIQYGIPPEEMIIGEPPQLSLSNPQIIAQNPFPLQTSTQPYMQPQMYPLMPPQQMYPLMPPRSLSFKFLPKQFQNFCRKLTNQRRAEKRRKGYKVNYRRPNAWNCFVNQNYHKYLYIADPSERMRALKNDYYNSFQ